MSSESFRVVTDSLGDVKVPASRYYGPQTERSRRNFSICLGKDRMPIQIIRSLAMIKEAAAKINCKHKRISAKKASAIISACREICSGKFDDEFPLVIWQTGSGTQTNMNVNEVIATRASELLEGQRLDILSVHPNDDVNKGQSTNDIFPTAIHISVAIETLTNVMPALENLSSSLERKMLQFMDVVKIGRTHMQDAVPITVGQELSGYVAQMRMAIDNIKRELPRTCQLAVGGTAVGTGLNCTTGFAEEVCEALTDAVMTAINQSDEKPTSSLLFKPAENKFAALAGHDALVSLSGCFNTTATALMRLANDFCLLSSGPNCGFGEFILPANEPGSSIMPGKINPTQCEALRMVCVQIMANHFAVTIAGASGEFELNVYKPLIAAKLLHSCELLTDSARSFAKNCVDGLELNLPQIQAYVERSLMLVTALTPHLGYDKAAEMALYAAKSKISLKEAAIQLQILDAEEYDKLVKPREMAFPHQMNGCTNSKTA